MASRERERERERAFALCEVFGNVDTVTSHISLQAAQTLNRTTQVKPTFLYPPAATMHRGRYLAWSHRANLLQRPKKSPIPFRNLTKLIASPFMTSTLRSRGHDTTALEHKTCQHHRQAFLPVSATPSTKLVIEPRRLPRPIPRTFYRFKLQGPSTETTPSSSPHPASHLWKIRSQIQPISSPFGELECGSGEAMPSRSLCGGMRWGLGPRIVRRWHWSY
ncbi:hypothetical protein K458DRAFT_70315 [Lentithecium fluviatile CBS 122367]|uniref:Uncharacterized protein n=1 Tax=Lentithecium fluviatile CBS 122367 TaxID=1168545 RepID=A0A6G1JL72_9PLEO|nr:hypothetical protein K458DRAFT_70315 [Lentithecium fluviatile CBS 122367]